MLEQTQSTSIESLGHLHGLALHKSSSPLKKEGLPIWSLNATEFWKKKINLLDVYILMRD